MSMLLAALFLSLSFAGAQQTKIKKAPIRPTPANSGERMYKQYCAACHGKDGKGDGPAVAALKTPPADLTMLAMNNGGKFPAEHVIAVLQMGTAEAAHGTKDMPVWGPLFYALGGLEPSTDVAQLRISNLTNYIKSIQMK